MTEKVLEFEGGVPGDNVTAGTGNVSGLNTVTINGGSAKYDTASAFYGSVGVTVTNVAGSAVVLRMFIDPPGVTSATVSSSKMSFTFCVTLPTTVPTEVETFAQTRYLPSSGGAKFAYAADGSIRFYNGVAGHSGIIVMTSTDRAALPNRQLRGTLTADAASPNSINAAAVTVKLYNNAGVQVGATYTGIMDMVGVQAGTAFAGLDVGRISGNTSVRTYGFDHQGINDGVLTEIGPAQTRLTTPVITLDSTTNPTTSSGLGSVTISWPPVAGASRYDAYRATTVGTPAQGDFVLYASGVTSPCDFTGQAAGTYQYGIKAVV
jgi:hypothetical protein